MGEITLSVQIVLGILGALVTLLLVGPIAFIGRAAIKDLKELEKQHDIMERSLPIDYVRKEDYKSDMVEVKHLLHQIFEKLDGKEDRRHTPRDGG